MSIKNAVQHGVILLLITGSATGCFAQATAKSGASLEETMQWIKMRLSGATASWVDDNGFTNTGSYIDVVGNSCSLTYTFVDDLVGNQEVLIKTTVTLPLNQLSGARYTPNWANRLGAVSLESANSVIPYKRTTTGRDGVPAISTGKGSSAPLPVSDFNLAQRLKTAFSHAIELCGGKKEAF